VNHSESLTLNDPVLAYQSRIKEVAAKFSKSVPYSAKVVSSHPCERRASYLLENHPGDGTRFDPYYGLKHDHATRKLVDALKNSIHSMGISNVHVITEYRTDMGFNDVVIVAGSPVRLFAEGSEIVRIELKASEGFDFEQLDRYILDRVPVIFARVPTGQVAYFDPEKLRDYITFSAEQQIPKMERLLRDEPIIVSGRWCQDCPDLSCPHNKNHRSNTKRYVQVPRAAFAEDICSHLENLPAVLEQIVALVNQTLEGKLPKQIEQ
jgi:hypothetical protein